MGYKVEQKPQNSEFSPLYGTLGHMSVHYVNQIMNLRVPTGFHVTTRRGVPGTTHLLAAAKGSRALLRRETLAFTRQGLS
jgi:hypothetical protein